MTVRPRRLVHRGVVDAAAFFVSRAPSEIRARERIIGLAAGSEIHRVAGGWIVVLRAPTSVTCVRAPGAPLVAVGKGRRLFSAAPLDDDEIEALAARDGFVLVRGSEAEVVASEGLEDPSAWLDVEGFTIADAVTLGVVPPPPARVLVPVADTRTLLGGAAPPAELAALVAALAARAAKAKGAASAATPPKTVGTGGGSIFDGIFAMLGAFASLFGGGRGGGGDRAPAPQTGSSSRALASLPQAPSGPSWLERARARMLDAVARLLVRARMASFFEKKHAAYLQRMLQLFEDGDIDEALRHAIPLGDGASTDGTSEPAFLPPTPRSSLDISMYSARTRRSLGLGDDLFDHLRKRYRAAFEKLDAAGRYKDAAFVLVELLGETAEAISYLERHEMFRLAAEIAEARRLAPGIVVRQWMLAGDPERAVAIARLHGAFADAVVRLEASHPDRAIALRMLWADSLAGAGAFAAAIDVVWKIAEARALALQWIDRAIDAGGPVGARMLARKVKIVPDAYPDVRDAALALLDDDAPVEALAIRRAFGDELAIPPATPEVQVLARPTARVLARDGADTALLDRVVVATSDLVLRAEIAATTRVSSPAPVISTEPIVRGAADRGAIAATDAALLPDGKILVALGEAGARLLAPDGRTIARFLEPAHSLVISDHGDRAIAIAPRGKSTWRLSRIDLASRRVRTWRDARFDFFAPDFDGATWMVGDSDALHAIDVLDDAWRALWSAPEKEGLGVARSSRTITLLRRGPEVLTYDVAGYVLRKRYTVPADAGTRVLPSPAIDGAIVGIHPVDTKLPASQIRLEDGSGWRTLYDVPGDPDAGAPLGDQWTFVTFRDPHGVTLHVVRPDSGATTRVVFEGATRASARRRGDHLLTYDDRGRILLLSTLERRVAREWRLS